MAGGRTALGAPSGRRHQHAEVHQSPDEVRLHVDPPFGADPAQRLCGRAAVEVAQRVEERPREVQRVEGRVGRDAHVAAGRPDRPEIAADASPAWLARSTRASASTLPPPMPSTSPQRSPFTSAAASR